MAGERGQHEQQALGTLDACFLFHRYSWTGREAISMTSRMPRRSRWTKMQFPLNGNEGWGFSRDYLGVRVGEMRPLCGSHEKGRLWLGRT
jgi:hypothetical protein